MIALIYIPLIIVVAFIVIYVVEIPVKLLSFFVYGLIISGIVANCMAIVLSLGTWKIYVSVPVSLICFGVYALFMAPKDK